MAHYDLILKNATCVSFSEKSNDMQTQVFSIGVTLGKIASVSIAATDTAEKIMSLEGLHLCPGIIDSQVHFREPGMTHKEDLDTGTRSALLGGVTSIFEMPNTMPPTTTNQLFEDKLNLAKKRAHCHYGFFIGGASDNISELAKLEMHRHCAGVKVFLGSSFGNLLVDDDLIFENILKNGKRRVIIHSEDEKRLKERKSIAVASGLVKDHPIWRDEESALISTRKSVRLAKKHQRPIHILHVSSSEEMFFLKMNKDIATVEILPQFLVLSSPECYERLGSLAQQNPPIRDKRHLEHLWAAVNDGTVDIIASDHAPHTLEEKQKPYPNSPSGVPGVQTLFPIMLNQVNLDRMDLQLLVRMLTENPRRIFSVKNKGRLQVGFDADFTVFDLKRTETIQKKWLASKVGWSPFENMIVKGWPVMSFLRGQLAMQEGEIQLPHAGEPVEFGQ